MIYVVDTNSFQVMSNYYQSIFKSYWEHLNYLVISGRLISTREVLRELQDETHPCKILDWVKANREIFKTPTSQETKFLPEIFQVPQFEKQMIKNEKILKGGPAADPFLVALTKIQNGCLVTEEGDKPNSAKLPTVCKHFGIQCTNLEGMLQGEEWEF